MYQNVGKFSKHALIYILFFNISFMINIYINIMLKHNTQLGDTNNNLPVLK